MKKTVWRRVITVALAASLLTSCTSGSGANTTSTVLPPAAGSVGTSPSGTGPADSSTSGTTTSSTSSTSTSADSFVTAEGTSFMVDGEPFKFVGVNVYDAAATDRYSCDPSNRMSTEELQKTFKTLHDQYGATVVRFWAYQTYTKSGQDYSGMDAVLEAAKAAGMRVLPVIEDGPGYCTTQDDVQPKAEYQDDTWFSEGYRKPWGTAPVSYRDYAKILVEHYRNDPTILGWSLINEADTSARDDQGRSVLVDFAQDMSDLVHDADPNHLLTLGTQSNGARGASGPDFGEVYGVPGLDFAEVHDWGYWGADDESMPGGVDGVPPAADSPECATTDALIGCSFAQLATLDKPLLVGEAGITGGDETALSTRASQLGAKMRAAFDAGAAGYLLWRVTKTNTDQYDITLSSNDPVLTTMAEVAASLK